MQQEILLELQRLTELRGLSWNQIPEWANTGTCQVRAGWHTLLHFYYNFQSDYYTLQFYPGHVHIAITYGFTDDRCLLHHRSYYHQGHEIERLFQWFDNQLQALRIPE